MEINKVPEYELTQRLNRFKSEMDKAYPDWELCGITGDVNMYYLTGTICDGLLLVRRSGDSVLWVRRSYERSVLESEFGDIRRMSTYRDVAGEVGALPDTLYLDTAHATMAWCNMLRKYMPFKNILPLDLVMLKTRAVKSEYELAHMMRAGITLDLLLKQELPSFLREGISEAQLSAELFPLFVINGHHGLNRFSGADAVMGHLSFGESPLYPAVFDGASGSAGLCPAVPVLGSLENTLSDGDLIYVDLGFGIEGYHVDKTLIYSYKRPQPDHVVAAHRHCLELERRAAEMLRPGVKPSEIYAEIMDAVKPEYRSSFMGAPGRPVSFIGHSLGLYVNEWPVIAKGFDDPLEHGMTIALEPKIGIDGVGMVGSENTYLVTDTGGVSITGDASDIILCYG